MAARGIGLDLDTLPVIAVGVGFGIDYGIYILSRVQERTAAGMPLDDAVREAISGAGRTVAFTALTMTAGVLCFTLTQLRFVGEMALLLALWMATSAADRAGHPARGARRRPAPVPRAARNRERCTDGRPGSALRMRLLSESGQVSVCSPPRGFRLSRCRWRSG